MPQKTILTAGPSITKKEIDYVLDAVTFGWNDNWNGYLKRFEQAFADYTATRFALSTSSCTGALHLALLALGVGPSDEVIVPEITWVATASAVTYTGAKPVFADVDADTWCLDPQSAERAVTGRTKAIVPVHLYGHPTEMPAIHALAAAHKLKVLEDAAPALGAEVDGKKVGGLSDVAAFSFQGAKIMTTGEGGMLVTNDEAVYERAKFLGDHGRGPHVAFKIAETGYKYKMSNVQAALGLAQLERIEELVAKKRQIYAWYRQRLSDLPQVQLNAERPWARNIYWMTSIVLGPRVGISRDGVMAQLKERHVDSRPFFPPASSFPMYANAAERNPVAYRVSANGINLPSGHNLTESDVDYVCAALTEVLCKRSRRAA
ncbi:MAG TPA: DegT/DnrJ/EryC1/StrS family aminotransferase [Pirellulales bacterium]|nr:DegT/DnrJ/EryC1/StrS family aminotransferase [Pirellulales bacterium]